MASTHNKKKSCIDSHQHKPEYWRYGIATHVYNGARRQYLAAKKKYESAIAGMKELGLPVED
jgi:hypothetical protein